MALAMGFAGSTRRAVIPSGVCRFFFLIRRVFCAGCRQTEPRNLSWMYRASLAQPKRDPSALSRAHEKRGKGEAAHDSALFVPPFLRQGRQGGRDDSAIYRSEQIPENTKSPHAPWTIFLYTNNHLRERKPRCKDFPRILVLRPVACIARNSAPPRSS